MSRLEVEGLHVARGGRTVLHGVSLAVEPGRVLALLGRNGAGKSSLVAAMAGLVPATAGVVRLDGRPLTGLPPDRIRRAGLAAVPEGHRVLGRLTIRDNLAVAGGRDGFARGAALFPELAPLAARGAGSLSGGQQQMLALAQALVARPRFLVLDEMSLGLAPLVVRRLLGAVRAAVAEGVGLLLIEQFTALALEMADTACLLDRGRLTFTGAAATLAANPRLLEEAYFGGEA